MAHNHPYSTHLVKQIIISGEHAFSKDEIEPDSETALYERKILLLLNAQACKNVTTIIENIKKAMIVHNMRRPFWNFVFTLKGSKLMVLLIKRRIK